MAVELAAAYISLIPSFKGGSQAISRELEQSAEKAGREAGEKAGKGFEHSFSTKLKAIGGVALGAGLGAAVAGGMFEAMGQDASNDMLAAQLGINNPEFAAELGATAGKIYSNNFGDSVSGVNDAIKAVLNEGLVSIDEATPEEIEAVTEKALTLGQVFQQDVGGLAAAAGQMIKTGLADNATEAFDIITRGFQQGVDKRGDFLDTLNEYGTQFRKLGIDGVAATALLSQGLRGGARDADLVADAIKEFSIRAVDGSDATAFGFEAMGLHGEDMTAKIAKGGADAAEGLQMTLDGLRAIEDPVLRGQAAVALFGTQAEDMGEALFKLDFTRAVNGLGNVAGAAEKVADQVGDNASAKIETFKRKALQTMTNFLGSKVIPALESTAKWIGDNTELIIALGAGITAALVPAFVAWAAAAIPAAAATVLAAAPVIALGVAIGGLAYLVITHWDTIKGAVKAGVDFVGGLVSKLVDIFKRIPGWIGAAVRGLADILTRPYKSAFNLIAKMWNSTVGKLSFKAPSWIPGIGGKGFDVPDIPTFHDGAFPVPGRPGQDVIARVQAGETIIPAGMSVGDRVKIDQHFTTPFDPETAMTLASRRAGRYLSMAGAR